MCKIAVAKNRKFATARGISIERASAIGLPVSIDSARANFSRSRSIMARILYTLFVAALPDPLPDDPLPLVESWLKEAAAVARNATAMTLATVTPEGQATARMVICRGFDVRAGWLVFYTDRASDKGRDLEIVQGDVAVLPAGTGHQCLWHSPDLVVIGAYPKTGRYDLCRGSRGEHTKALKTIPGVPLPETDPVFGKEGPLLRLWQP